MALNVISHDIRKMQNSSIIPTAAITFDEDLTATGYEIFEMRMVKKKKNNKPGSYSLQCHVCKTWFNSSVP